MKGSHTGRIFLTLDINVARKTRKYNFRINTPMEDKVTHVLEFNAFSNFAPSLRVTSTSNFCVLSILLLNLSLVNVFSVIVLMSIESVDVIITKGEELWLPNSAVRLLVPAVLTVINGLSTVIT